jgi:hypothetical protein
MVGMVEALGQRPVTARPSIRPVLMSMKARAPHKQDAPQSEPSTSWKAPRKCPALMALTLAAMKNSCSRWSF